MVEAGKKGYAGRIELAELEGVFGGAPDPLWEEISGQMQEAFREREFDAVIQDNETFEPAFSEYYQSAGSVFGSRDVFWPVTGWRIRPETIYQIPGEAACQIETN